MYLFQIIIIIIIKFYFLQIIYGGLPDENKREEEEILDRRTRGRKINYREAMASDSEEVRHFKLTKLSYRLKF